MRGAFVVGMMAGCLTGAIATAASMPYVKPQMRRAVKKGRRALNCTLNKFAR